MFTPEVCKPVQSSHLEVLQGATGSDIGRLFCHALVLGPAFRIRFAPR